MKKIWLLTALIFSSLILVWCNNSTNSNKVDLSTTNWRLDACVQQMELLLNTNNYAITWDDEQEAWASFVINGHIENVIPSNQPQDDFECVIDMVSWSVDIIFPTTEWDEVEEVNQKQTVQSIDMNTYLELIWSHQPDGYTYSIYDEETKETSTWEHENTVDDLGYLTPENHNIIDREITSSGIEDGMIYTIVKSTFDDNRVIDILYIVDPTTYNFVAASYNDWTKSYHYQFYYNEKEVEISTWELYSTEELAVAEYTINEEWFNKWDVKTENVVLKYLWDEKSRDELSYCKEIWEANNIMVDECAVFESSFFVPEQDAMMAWALEPNKTLTWYQWYLGRINNWAWHILTAGY